MPDNHMHLHHNYDDGPLEGEPIQLADWLEGVHYHLHEESGDQHLYVRRSLIYPTWRDIPSSVVCGVYYAGTLHPPLSKPMQVPLHFVEQHALDTRRANELAKEIEQWIKRTHSASLSVVIVEVKDPAFSVSQTFHATTSFDYIKQFVDFVREPVYEDNIHNSVAKAMV